MFSLFFRNLFFTILQPGIVAGVMPFYILKDEFKALFIQSSNVYKYVGVFILLIGFIIMLSCIISFAIKGRGTLSPADPTKKLVVTGLYKFSRNLMYACVLIMLCGEAIFFQSAALNCYALFICITFTIFIIQFEEPRLSKDFGAADIEYCRKVRR